MSETLDLSREEMAARVANDIQRKYKIEITPEIVLSFVSAETPEECGRLASEYYRKALDAKRRARPHNPKVIIIPVSPSEDKEVFCDEGGWDDSSGGGRIASSKPLCKKTGLNEVYRRSHQ